MKLYHGSNVEVVEPKIFPRLRALDFGAGFYTTSSFEQAQRWSKSVVKRSGVGAPIVSVYEWDESCLADFKFIRFETASPEWLDFVVANRMKTLRILFNDIVIGPVANDSTLPVIDDYISGIFTREYAIQRLMPQRLTDQYAFLTEKALSTLRFVESMEVR